eukprot:5115728-Prymnesium_polylepis.1
MISHGGPSRRTTPGARLSSNGACGLRGQRARARAARPRPSRKIPACSQLNITERKRAAT